MKTCWTKMLPVILIVAVLMSFILPTIPVSADASWYDDDWLYRKAFTVSRPSGAVTDYQMSLNVYKLQTLTDYASNPVISIDTPTGSGGPWDNWNVYGMEVMTDNYGVPILDDGLIRCFFNGGHYWDAPADQIGTATSPDGKTWTKSEDNPVVPQGSNPSWEYPWVAQPCFVYVPGDEHPYKVYYTASNQFHGENTHDSIGLAYADDPEGPYTKYAGNPVFAGLGSGTTEYGRGYQCIIYENGAYRMWYTGLNSSYEHTGIYYATSSDGINWTSQGLTNLATGGPWVRRLDEDTLLGVSYWSGFYTSTDGINWTSLGGALVMPSGQTLMGNGGMYRSSRSSHWNVYYASGTVGDTSTIRIRLQEGSADSSSSVNLYGLCQDDFDDLRFTTSDGTTLLPYWVESSTTTSATVWVKFDSIGTSDTTFYIYYGNSEASTASSGTDTFPLGFSDFETGSNGDSLSGLQGWSIQSGTCKISTDHAYGGTRSGIINANSGVNRTLTPATQSYEIRARVWKESATQYFNILHGDASRQVWNYAAADQSIYYFNNNDTGKDTVADSWRLWQISDIKFSSGYTSDLYENNSLVFNNAALDTNVYSNGVLWFLNSDTTSGHDFYIDNLFIRNWRSTEPTVTGWEEAESQPPIVTTQAGSSVTDTTATGNGTITDIGGSTPTVRGICYSSTESEPTLADDYEQEAGSFTAEAFDISLTGLSPGTTYYLRAFATSASGTGYGSVVTILTKPAAPAGVAASDGTSTALVTVTWTKSTSATGYKVYRDGDLVDTLGDVATYDDEGADAPTITAGSAAATDGSSTSYTTLSSNAVANNGTSHSYTVKALNATGDSSASTANTGYRGAGSLTYQWQRSAGDSDDSYSDLSGATTNPYNDTTGTAGAGYYYKVSLTATGASNATSTADRGYKASEGSVTPAVVTTSAATNVEDDTATSGGNITNTGDSNVTERGICYGTSANPTTSGDKIAETEDAPYGTGVFSENITGLSTGTTYHVRAYAINTAGTSYGSDITFLTKPTAPAGVAASDGTSSTEVTVTWTDATGATSYSIYRGATLAGTAGSGVQTFSDTGADSPVVTPGTATAGDGASTSQVALAISGASIANGTTHTYKVVASNATGNSADSSTNTGYRIAGSLAYQWYRSSGTGDSGFSILSGATTSSYNDTSAPVPTITVGTISVSQGSSTSQISVSVIGAVANAGAARYYYCVVSATGSTSQNTTHNAGNIGVGTLGYQWYKSSGASDTDFSAVDGATSSSYDDTEAPAPTITAGTITATDGTYNAIRLTSSGASANVGATRYYYCAETAAGAANQSTAHSSGWIGVGSLTRQWQRSSGDSDASYSDIDGATTAVYDDSTPPDLAGRYYKCVLNATGASQQTTSSNRGYLDISMPSPDILDKINNYTAFAIVLEISPTVLLIAWLAAILSSFFIFRKRIGITSMLPLVLICLSAVVLPIVFSPIMTAFDNLLLGLW